MKSKMVGKAIIPLYNKVITLTKIPRNYYPRGIEWASKKVRCHIRKFFRIIKRFYPLRLLYKIIVVFIF